VDVRKDSVGGSWADPHGTPIITTLFRIPISDLQEEGEGEEPTD